MKRLLIVVLMAGLTLGTVSCAIGEEPMETEQPPGEIDEPEEVTPGPEAPGVMLEEVAQNPSAYYGEQVMVYGEVSERLSPRAITVSDDALLDPTEMLVIDISEEAVDAAQEAGVPLEVVGEVRRFVGDDVREAFDLALDDQAYADFEGEPVIVAASAQALTTQAIFGEREATLEALLNNPESFYGEQVAVGGAVADVLSDRSYALAKTLAVPSERVLVLTESADVLDLPLKINDLVEVQGEVRAFDRGTIGEDVDVDLSDAAYGAYEGRPVIVAESAFVMADEEMARMRRARVLRPARINDERMLTAVISAPQGFYGRWTKVAGAVAGRIGERSFAVGGLNLPIEGDLLVVNVYGETSGPFEEDAPVMVAGEVREFDRGQFEELLEVDLSAEEYADYAGQPAMVAETVRVVSDRRLAEMQEGALELVSEIPEEYVDQQVTVRGNVSQSLGGGAFTLVGGDLLAEDAVLVVGASEETRGMETIEGETLRVMGEVRRFDVAGIERAFDLELDDGLFEGYEGEAVIVAKSAETISSD